MRHVIVGNGVAGITAAAELARRRAGDIVVYTAERHPYYFRPQLPRLLAGEVAADGIYARPASWYEERGIDVHLSSRVVRLSPGQKRLLVEDGTEVPYDRLLLATGSVPFVPPIEGIGQAGVFTLRTLDDALKVRERAADCREAVVIGGGLLGLETARGLRALGLSVTVLETSPHLLPRQLDREGAAVLQRLVEGMGIGVVTGARAGAVLGDGGAERVVLEDGREFPAQVVLVAAGVRCNAALAAEAGLEVNRGVVVDERMATSAPDIYAAGDVASFRDRSWSIIPQARAQARVAAANMAGEGAVYEEIVPSTTLKIVGISLTSCGVVTAEEGEGFVELRRSDPEAGTYGKLVMEDGRLVGAIVIGNRSLARRLEKLVVARATVDRQEASNLLKEVRMG